MKLLKSILGTFQTWPTWLRACLAIPFLAAAATLTAIAGQSRGPAILPSAGANAAQPASVAQPGTVPVGEKSKETVVIHGSLSGNPRPVEDPQHIHVFQ